MYVLLGHYLLAQCRTVVYLFIYLFILEILILYLTESSSKTTAAPGMTAKKTTSLPVLATTHINSSWSYNVSTQPTEKKRFYRPTSTTTYLTVVKATKIKENNKKDNEEKNAGNRKNQRADSRDVIIIAAASAVGLILGLTAGILVQTFLKKRNKRYSTVI